ncbi:hypothetical protein GA0074692_3379 [Micromonospora pallida]|uniref:Uncharacterized protein n=1 Tax=Micromonospora pallida TaxID=145854 RepID=A0A1C6SSW8_9ACTN|nr:hypothetical protein [Micromonospora pallida]SCL32686.1 hypothetical protein GA0074692_3379 [Micromonospora pallida]
MSTAPVPPPRDAGQSRTTGPAPDRFGWAELRLALARPMRIGNTEIRPLGGGLGCLLMILFSVLASIALTVLVNTVL